MISRWKKGKTSKESILPKTHHDVESKTPDPSTSKASKSKPKFYSNGSSSRNNDTDHKHPIKANYRSPKPGSINCIPRHHANIHINPNAVGCTTFLMGGQYYPGKDKNRLHLRRKTLWYRICWSSPFRKILSAILVVYLLIVYVLNPALNTVLRYGDILSHHGNYTDLDTIAIKGEGKLVHLKPLYIAKEDAKHIMKRLKEIKNEKMSIEKRKALIKKIIPEWFRKEHHISEDLDITDPEELNTGNVVTKQEEAVEPDFDAVAPDEEIKTPELSKRNSNEGPGQDETDSNSNIDVARTLQNRGIHAKDSQCPRGVEDISTTLVIQSTLDRARLIFMTCQKWRDPINLVVYLSSEESSSNDWDKFKEESKNVCPHVKIIVYHSKSSDERRLEYPINKLRNIGLDHVITSHVLVIDIDFIPSERLDNAVHKAIDLSIEARMDDDGNRGVDPKDALVIPAFERKLPSSIECKTLQDCQNISAQDPTFIPKSMKDLRQCVQDENCVVFQSDVNVEGHFDTGSNQWLAKNDTESLSVIECFHSQRYEPYVVLPWCPLEHNAVQRIARRVPRSSYYDERFYGYGKNKIQQIAHLREHGFKFQVIPATGFLVHHPHPESETKSVWNDKSNFDLHKKMDELYPKYLQELRSLYDGNFVETKLCQRKRGNEKKYNQ